MHLTRSMSTGAAWGIALALFLGPPPARSAGVEDFYKGKTVSLLIGYSVGGGYDAYGRLVARHLGKHIPGNPNVQPQNMTGAGSLNPLPRRTARSSARSRGARASRRCSTRPSSTAPSSPGSAALPMR